MPVQKSLETYWMHHVYMICKHILLMTFLKGPELNFLNNKMVLSVAI